MLTRPKERWALSPSVPTIANWWSLVTIATLYVLDPQTLEVKKRVWVQINPYEMVFSKDGKTLVIEDTKPDLYFFDTTSWKQTGHLKKLGYIAYASAADLLVALNQGHKESSIHLINPNDQSVISEIKLPHKLAAVGISADGKLISAITDAIKTDQEKRERAPKDKRGLDKLLFEQQMMRKISKVFWFDATGKELGVQDLWYSSKGKTRLLMPDEAVHVINYSNVNATITRDGEVKLFQLQNSFNYGHGASPDQSKVGSGGLRNGSLTDIVKREGKTFKLDQLPSWPEYFEAFTVDSEGNLYGVTTAYRLTKVKADGSIDKTVPIH